MLHSKVLITGGAGFTGSFLKRYLESKGLKCFNLSSNILNLEELKNEIKLLDPDYVVHLAAVSFSNFDDLSKYYNVNVVGTVNLLEAIKLLPSNKYKRIILASSAAVYGNHSSGVLSEDMTPYPVNHYGCSKLSMEHIAQTYSDFMNILVVRPFNYVGPGQNGIFLIPKIIDAYKRDSSLELGNLDVSREFNDIRDVCDAYFKLLNSDFSSGEIVNICSGRLVSLEDIIKLTNEIFNTDKEVAVNPLFVRENEIKSLCGDPSKLQSIAKMEWRYDIRDTLLSMV
ncbi:NAD-dependent epimerase/dehydratase family protein [Rhodanobacter aciditrophus]|uniref:NAD-dependent epimerase/dehydratase family protein n=1 Tax=Rhodanobacter aciditrophus TaxID=1623218 RepID=A0ABW4B102_9GAMM